MSSKTGVRVFVGNVRDEVTSRDLQDAFLKFGPIVEVVVKSAYAFVVFESREDAIYACDSMNGKWCLGSYLNVRLAFKRVEDRNEEERRRISRRIKDQVVERRSNSFSAVAAQSQPPPDRRRPPIMARKSSSPAGKGRARDNYEPTRPSINTSQRNPFRSMNDNGSRSAAGRDRTLDRTHDKAKKDFAPDSKDYRLTVNNLSSTIKWREIAEFMQKEGDLTLTEDGRRKDFDKSYFVDFATRRGMEDCLKRMDGLEIAGKTVRVYIDDRPEKKGDKKMTRKSSRPRPRRRGDDVGSSAEVHSPE